MVPFEFGLCCGSMGRFGVIGVQQFDYGFNM